ncbi:uncharacterized protein LOC124281064 isoform X2 [Haliotis rubra]|uniref:uncharacterized protein LOC124281064 isoform X2 n=1 Tax=Haliotis rubra TaxID=36100 RepID=UPI001EE53563|nr:uncharacterized protein LOC124281064 isoform X2 [Haliotis rubra]
MNTDVGSRQNVLFVGVARPARKRRRDLEGPQRDVPLGLADVLSITTAPRSLPTLSQRGSLFISSLKGEKTVLYRVFCCKEHEDQYRRNLKHYLSSTSTNNNNSDDASDFEGDPDFDKEYQEFDYDALSQNTNTTFVQISDTDSPVKRRTKEKHVPDESGDKSMFSSGSNDIDSISDDDDDHNNNGVLSDEVETQQKRKADNTLVSSTSAKKSKTGSLNGNLPELSIECVKIDSPESKNDQTIKMPSSSVRKSALSLKKNGGKKLIVKITNLGGKDKHEAKVAIDDHMVDHKGDHSGDQNTSSEGTSTTAPPTSSGTSRDAYAICIVGEKKSTLKIRQQLEKQVSKKLDVKTSNIFIWQDLSHTPSLTKQSMVCFIQDLTERFLKQDVPEVTRLLFDNKYLEGKDKKLYQVQGGFLQRLNNQDIINQTQELAWSSITTQISKMGHNGGVFKPDGKRTLVLLLNDFIDKDGSMREKLGVPPDQEQPDMVTWTSATVVTKTTNEDTQKRRLEVQTILRWLSEKYDNIGHVFVHPQEDILIMQSEENYGINDIIDHLQSSKSETSHHAAVMIFRQIDAAVVNFQAYCRKAFHKVLPFCLKSGVGLAVLIDIRSLSTASIHQQIGDVFVDEEGRNVPVTIRSVFDPSSIPVSFVVIEVDADKLKVQKSHVSTPVKQPPKRSQYPKDLQKPSTSGVKRKSLKTRK